MSTITVATDVPILELDYKKSPAITRYDPEWTLQVRNADLDSDQCVMLCVAGHKYKVCADVLHRAINNATNQPTGF